VNNFRASLYSRIYPFTKERFFKKETLYINNYIIISLKFLFNIIISTLNYIPFRFILFLLFSKEIFSFDSELFVILCIITIFSIVYSQKNIIIFNFKLKYIYLKKEYSKLLFLRKHLEKEIKNFIYIFILIENQLINVYC
jgi:hypothetical protein